MAVGGTRHPQHRAEAPGIVVAERSAVIENNVDVVVRASRWGVLERPQATGHAEVDQQRFGAQPEEQVLASAVDTVDPTPAQTRSEIGRNRPAEPPVVYMQRRDMSTGDEGRNATACRFDFGKFGHDVKLERMQGRVMRCASVADPGL